MTGEPPEALDLLGGTWRQFRSVCDEWLRSHPPTEDWERNIPPEERHSLHVGAFLHAPGSRELAPWDYDATPKDSVAFASTGGDGEHYSVLIDPAVRGVIVLTAPMAFDQPNTVVGASITDFLGLVVVQGLAAIPNLAYCGIDRGAADLAEAEPPGPESLLAAVRGELAIQPWEHIADRLRVLHDTYATHVRRTRP